MATDAGGAEEVAPEEPTQGAKPHAVAFRQQVKGVVDSAHSDGEITKRVVDALAEKQIAERVMQLTKALAVRDEMSRKLDKIHPDLVSFDVKGGKTSEGYSKAKLEELNKTREELNKLDKAIAKAVDYADYNHVLKFIGG